MNSKNYTGKSVEALLGGGKNISGLMWKYLKERGQTVEPMQGLVKEIFDLDRCWMRGNDSNR